MTRINTNVSSLIAQNTLARTNADLQVSLTRLSTGLRINTGKDDPAGLIASENLRRDISSVEKAISNSERANQLIATADSALGQVSSLLNDIRGLITEAANSGVLSDEQIAVNQLQVDSSLEALNRISQTTTFQGRRLLDGSLNFTTTGGTNFAKLTDLRIDQASLASGTVGVDIAVATAATQAQVDVTNIAAQVPATAFQSVITIDDPEVQAAADFIGSGLTDAATVAGTVTALSTGAFNGAAGNGFTIVFAEDSGETEHTAALTDVAELTVTVGTSGAGATIALQTIFDDLADQTDFADNFSHNITAGVYTIGAGDDLGEVITLGGGEDDGEETITIDGNAVGADLNTTFAITTAAPAAGNVDVIGDIGTGFTIRVASAATVTLTDIKNALDTYFATDSTFDYTVTTANTGGNDNSFIGGTDTGTAVDTDGAAISGGLAKKVVFELGGSEGSEVFQFQANSSIDQVVNAINLVKDATGVEAVANGLTLELKSTSYGSSSVVDVNIIEEETGGTFKAAIGEGKRTIGDDIVGTVNGVTAKGTGNTLSINTATLDLTASLEAGFSGTASFTIDGGGALFQLGPDVVINQQARLGIRSVNSARLGGISGKLFELSSGGAASLGTDVGKAAKIIDETIGQVTGLRGRLGAFQRTTLETNIFTLNDTLANLTDAESSIRDADFAVESARLTRAQILVQSGTSVLAIANSNPQNVLALLR